MKLTITRALAELKLLDKRIRKEIEAAYFVAGVQKKKKIMGMYTKEEFSRRTQGEIDSIQYLIERRKVIKSAVVNSNAKTMVTIAGNTMTVAEAIERKTSIEYEKELLQKIKKRYHTAYNEVENANMQVKQKLDILLESNFGKDIKASANDVEAISKPYLEQNEWELVDTLGIVGRIEKFEKEIDEFEHEVDFVLSESNTITTIEIPD
ncbi:hypothetical protein [Pseudobacteroides cellulosolvens]|uniref:Uncharacterized protein n=1 Tax=Pseudobacteroides cellulosolvens ATCC 35603 = DSM 2933 TaxID=398512 RepID=A0A0L6JPT2_9FIRM|nr:hypothetical protein [Pseudobacteroides cellulosolvens]KNY27788.1 hypothetical protein Bccel_3059 [Pseudobacteroides cellulosolvens ATCC 35603 = DSM 2933]